MKTYNIAITGILAAVICLLAPLSIPAGAVPLSLATFAVYVASCAAGPKHATSAVAIYILLGAAGLPVFSAFRGGFHILAGVTGGYIIGYIPCALIVSLLTEKFSGKKFIYPLSMALGTLTCYLIGTVWYAVQAEVAFTAALSVCILPFIVGDIIKIAAASALGIALKKHRIRRLSK